MFVLGEITMQNMGYNSGWGGLRKALTSFTFDKVSFYIPATSGGLFIVYGV